MKFIFCLMPEQGHINPYIGVAQALQEMKHQVLVASVGDISAQMEKCGLPFTEDLVMRSAPPPPKGKELVALLENPAAQKIGIVEGFLKPVVHQVQDWVKFFRKENPDLLVIDPMNYAAVIAAQKLQIRWAGVSSSLTSVIPDDLRTEIRAMVDELSPLRAEIFAQFGPAPSFRAVDALSPFLNISFSTSAFIGTPPPEVQAVGPSRPLRARGDEVEFQGLPKEKKIVYVSFGSQVFYQPEIFRKVQGAGKQLGIHLVMSVGDLKQEPGWDSTPGCDLYAYAPQLEILKNADLFLTHGGANSVAEGISAGVPLVVFPICNDQSHQAFFVDRSGIGRSLDLRTANVTEISEVLGAVLADSEIKKRMNAVSTNYQQNGAIKAAELLVQAGS